MAFYCNGKQGICDCDCQCENCEYFDNTGGRHELTNADIIRKMTDEELAELLVDGCRGSKCDEQPLNDFGSVNCFECRMKWLKQEV